MFFEIVSTNVDGVSVFVKKIFSQLFIRYFQNVRDIGLKKQRYICNICNIADRAYRIRGETCKKKKEQEEMFFVTD